ncbi:cytochrome b [Halocynthiibacter styelae]|uniref:Cytochrome b/b6 domain-containing protein n=1 Tax=Halocynthiibacter styelae TaxID=2761955 RepID=A0A8J7IVB8_9RHOB|nr:cytochrome b/b6 domain-containing protein [Paenihalocynthiibacter styelae]MBI1493218.1 cytochrome b/b6 domain-containing protein [Paenihalocynthiibacter styelae]
MTKQNQPLGYSRTQIALHWGVAGLVAAQYLFKDSISQAWGAYIAGREVTFDPLIMAHVVGGVAILLLVIWRLVLRFSRGVPPAPEQEPAPLAFVGHLAHLAFYGLLAGLSISGALAWFLGIEPAAGLHEILKMALMALIILHVLAVAVHRFAFKSNVMKRMMHAQD